MCLDSFKKVKCHKGSVATVHMMSDNVDTHLICTGGTFDGSLVVHDMRSNQPVFSKQLHQGALNKVLGNMSGLIITCSADKTCAIIDPQSGFKEIGRLKCSDAAFTMVTAWNYTAVGCGDGNLLVFNNDTQECLYGFGAMSKGAVHAMKVSDDFTKLVVCGDDPTSLLINF